MAAVYQALDESPSTRVLDLLPGSDQTRVQIRQIALPAEDGSATEAYEALSYCWGDPSDVTPISINGQPSEVTKGLASALGRLRLPNRGRTLWADALCINQKDTAERSQQVGLMRRIYELATRVVVWLGDADEDTAAASQQAGCLANYSGATASKHTRNRIRHQAETRQRSTESIRTEVVIRGSGSYKRSLWLAKLSYGVVIIQFRGQLCRMPLSIWRETSGERQMSQLSCTSGSHWRLF
jgi:hypothetical protein